MRETIGTIHIKDMVFEGYLTVDDVDNALRSGNEIITVKLKHEGVVSINLKEIDYIIYIPVYTEEKE